MKMNTRKNVRGQGMSEYLIIVALIAVAGIAVMGLFGGAARNQVAGLATQATITASQVSATAAGTDAGTNVHLGNYAGGSAVIATGDGTGRLAGATGQQ